MDFICPLCTSKCVRTYVQMYVPDKIRILFMSGYKSKSQNMAIMCTCTLHHFFSGVKKSATEVNYAPLSCSLASSITFSRQIFVEISASTTSQSFLAKDTSTNQSFFIIHVLATNQYTQYVYTCYAMRERHRSLSL